MLTGGMGRDGLRCSGKLSRKGWGLEWAGFWGGLVELGWNVGRTKRGNAYEAGVTVPVTWHKKSLDKGVFP